MAITFVQSYDYGVHPLIAITGCINSSETPADELRTDTEITSVTETGLYNQASSKKAEAIY